MNDLSFGVRIFLYACASAIIIYLGVHYFSTNNVLSKPGQATSSAAQQPEGPPTHALKTDSTAYSAIEIYNYKQPPYAKMHGGPRINLVNNTKSANPTWQQLKDFVESDNTDSYIYDLNSFPCGAFAEMLHNHAETQGIRAAWVALDFVEKTTGHALNAFETIDRGLVYVDCVGDTSQLETAQYQSDNRHKIFGGRVDNDRIGYVQVGKEYGVISLAAAASPSYSYYEQYRDGLAKFKADLAAYNNAIRMRNTEVKEYNQWLKQTSLVILSAEAKKADRWGNDLQRKEIELEKAASALDKEGDRLGTFWVPQGTTKRAQIYW